MTDPSRPTATPAETSDTKTSVVDTARARDPQGTPDLKSVRSPRAFIFLPRHARRCGLLCKRMIEIKVHLLTCSIKYV